MPEDRLLVAIPARYGSTRFPGKPLAPVAGVPMLIRVFRQARRAAEMLGLPAEGSVTVATDDGRIRNFAAASGLSCVMTPAQCPTGSDRALAAARALGRRPDIVANWQGDNPCCPPEFVAALARELDRDPRAQVATPAVRLRWPELDALRASKLATPFSGTFVAMRPLPDPERPAGHGAAEAEGTLGRVAARGDALYFSKREIPALRGEKDRRASGSAFSPLLRHIGLYAARFETLERFSALPQGALEANEGLEQLRYLENGLPVRVLAMDDGGRAPPHGVDSPEDIPGVEAWLADADG